MIDNTEFASCFKFLICRDDTKFSESLRILDRLEIAGKRNYFGSVIEKNLENKLKHSLVLRLIEVVNKLERTLTM